MDKIEDVHAIRPVVVEVIDLEAHVRRNPRWLDLAEIRARNSGGGILITYLDAPDACARLQICQRESRSVLGS